MKITRLLVVLCTLTVSLTHAVTAGFAMSANEDVIKRSKKILVIKLHEMLKKFKFDDLDLPFKTKISELRFEAVEFDQEDVEVSIDRDKLIVHLNYMGGKLVGKSS